MKKFKKRMYVCMYTFGQISLEFLKRFFAYRTIVAIVSYKKVLVNRECHKLPLSRAFTNTINIIDHYSNISFHRSLREQM